MDVQTRIPGPVNVALIASEIDRPACQYREISHELSEFGVICCIGAPCTGFAGMIFIQSN